MRKNAKKAFTPEEFWDIHAELRYSTVSLSDAQLKMLVAKYQDKPFKPTSKMEADTAASALQAQQYVVSARDSRPQTPKPSAPFITSTLQQAASTRLGFGVKKTMMLAQRLYEAGHITYMRTDSTNLSKEAVSSARDFINDHFGSPHLPSQPNVYGAKDNAQEAHEAIRPSNVNVQGASLSDMERDAQRLYELIWRQFVACQMTPAKYDSTTLRVKAGDYELTAKGRVLKFAGWTKVQNTAEQKGEDVTLPDVKVGDVLALENLDPQQHFTKPPARYNEASLVKELEKRGDRSSFYLRQHYFDHSRSWLCTVR